MPEAVPQCSSRRRRPSRHRDPHVIPGPGSFACVFAIDIDILSCPECQSAKQLKSIATEPGDIRAAVGTAMRARPPPFLSTPPQLELDFAVG